MPTLQLYYVTNRKRAGGTRERPTGYTTKFSDDGPENLRFGRLSLNFDDARLAACLKADCGFGLGNGNALAEALGNEMATQPPTIEAFAEALSADRPDSEQPLSAFGSQAMFDELRATMLQAKDVLVYVHGFNVTWLEAVASALALQASLNQTDSGIETQKVVVVLFTWPSDGKALPYASYKSDRAEARISGGALGRALLKLRDYLIRLRTIDGAGVDVGCGQELHLLCHSMGNYVLQCALERLSAFTPGRAFPRLFEHIFLCAPDVDDDVLEPGHPLGSVHQLAQAVTVYSNRGDVAMYISDYTKGNPERLGHNGPARPALLHNKVHSVDCSPIVVGTVEHSYYQDGRVNHDLRLSLASVPFDSALRTRTRHPDLPNVWSLGPLT